MINVDMLFCLDLLNNAWTSKSSIVFWFKSSKIRKFGSLEFCAWGYFDSSIGSIVSFSIYDFSKTLS